MLRLYYVWSGSSTNDHLKNPYNDGHPRGIHWGEVYAKSLQEAADKVFGGPSGFDPNYDREAMTYHGSPIFEREPWYA